MAAVAAGVGAPTASGAEAPNNLYEAHTIVTGDRVETRVPGVRQCFVDVLVKVSGDPRLIGDPAVAALADRAGDFVLRYTARDRFADRPIRDEQGTRDHPHDLTVDFDPARIDDALKTLGRMPWTGARPRLALLVRIDQGAAHYVLTRDGQRGFGQRAALAAAADRVGLSVALPTEALLATSGLGTDVSQTDEQATMERLTASAGADLPLAGAMSDDEKALGWIVHWRLTAEGKATAWSVRGVSFDEAFRNALRGAAQVLSNNGTPR